MIVRKYMEFVGHINDKTEVLNKAQVASAMSNIAI